jgi:hypothetical protein
MKDHMHIILPEIPQGEGHAEIPPLEEELEAFNGCTAEEKISVQTAFKKGEERKLINQLAGELDERLVNSENIESLQNRIFLLTQGAIGLSKSSKPRDGERGDKALNLLGRRNLLRKLRPPQGFAIALRCVRLQHAEGFRKIVFNFKTIPKGEPYAHTELLLLKTKNGENLGHLAAKADFKEGVQYITCNHRDLIDITDQDGNTLTHHASAAQSVRTISYLINFSKKLFAKKNNQGKTALDLESGPQICRAIATAIVEHDLQKGEEVLQRSLEACRTLQKKEPIVAPPPVPALQPQVVMETIPLVPIPKVEMQEPESEHHPFDRMSAKELKEVEAGFHPARDPDELYPHEM